MDLPFADSRRLTGANRYFSEPGAVLETLADTHIDAAFIAQWHERVEFARAALGWPRLPAAARVQAGGCAFALAAPLDQLFVATEVNEWAFLCAMFPFSQREKVPERRMREKPGDFPNCLGAEKKLPFDEKALSFVRELRRTSTDPEQLIWSFVRDRRLHNHKFRRQHAIGPYVIAFYCHDLMLAIELDGSQHNESGTRGRDIRRDRFLAERGIETLRYWNNDVQAHLESVLASIWNRVEELSNVAANRSALPSSAPASIEAGAPSPEGRRVDLFHAPAFPAIWDDNLAVHTLRLASAAERRLDLIALLDAAQRRGLPVLLDDDELTLGEGVGARTWPLAALPAVDAVDWPELHAIPVALVAGSNGKTTTTRLVAAMLAQHGKRTAYCCTDGVFVDGAAIASGDYSGPAGARAVLRDSRVEAAVLETARGGILRRGLAVAGVEAAIVTNISADHFGEYGIRDLDGLADTKLVVARALAAGGILVLNADDETLTRRAATLDCKLAWFAVDADHPLLVAHRARGGATCGVRDGKLTLHRYDNEHALGGIADMPLTMRGAATYNIANIAGAASLASALDIPVQTIANTLAHFGSDNTDNPGRLMRWSFGATTVLLDYAHNPEGLQGLLDVANRLRLPSSGPSGHLLPVGEGNSARLAAALFPAGRLALVLGQAGNREDVDIRKLAATAVSFQPELIVLKDIESFLRGRAPGEVAAIIRDELLRKGMPAEKIVVCLDELGAAGTALTWAQAGDTVVLPIHDRKARELIVALLDKLAARGWRPSQSLSFSDA